MEKTCYVVMPYGGENPVQVEKMKSVYKNIIKAAAIKAGFPAENIFREDHSGEAGNIVRNVVNHVTSSSIVIVDMTGCNANVFYELGLSHAFHKNSTVLICEKGSQIKFDLSGAKRVEYIADFAKIDESVDAICEEIKSRLQGEGKSDNSVHELLPELPDHLLEMLERDDNALQAQLNEVIRDREHLRIQIKNAGIRLDSSHERKSVRDILKGTKKRMKFSGASLVEKLREYAENDEMDKFLDHLAEALELGTPTLSNINSIVEICSNMKNDALLEDVLCASRTLYPDDPELMTRLAKLYARRPATRRDAMELVNEAVGIKRDENGNYMVVDRSKISSHNDLARFMDTYLAMENYDELVAAATFLKQYVHAQEREMLDRNIFISLTRKGDLEAAGEMLDTIRAMDSDIPQYLIANYYNRCGEFVKEYEALEQAFLKDPEDFDYPRMLAAHILNEDLVRTEAGIQKVKPAESRKAAAALCYFVLESSSPRSSAAQSVLEMMQRSRNRLEGFLQRALPYLRGEEEDLPYEDTDRYPLDYLLAQIPAEQ